jgi:hypothetical protein
MVRGIGAVLALNKIDILALGRGSLTDNSNASIVFAANNIVATWSSANTYSQYNVVEYSGAVYRSKINSNTNNEPDTNPSDWETMYYDPKDGDVCVVVEGSSSTILQRKGGVWSALVPAPIEVSLVDGQVSPTPALVFLGSNLPFAKVEYTLARGSAPGRTRKGVFNVLNDAVVSSVSYDHEFTDIGTDVAAYMYWSYSGTNVQLLYTSTSESIPLTLRYTLSGWSYP